jgi:dolichol kinase
MHFLLQHENATVANNWYLPRSWSRMHWIAYWMATLLWMLPVAPTVSPCASNDPPSQWRSHVVRCRKWFHFIAVVLFTPTTLVAPILQSFAYAVAVALLLLLEIIRQDFPFINQFYCQYLDPNKELHTSRSANTGFVISHIALIVGCAAPLWASQFIMHYCRDQLLSSTTVRMIIIRVVLPMWGVICLGVGDAMGALVGTTIGKTLWFGTCQRRTMEGSIAMCLSMILSFYILTAGANNAVGTAAVWLPATMYATVIEAYTTQLDNLVLPLAGIPFILLLILVVC